LGTFSTKLALNKYAAVIDRENKKGNYLTEDELKNNVELIKVFDKKNNYDQIKANCARYSKGTEAKGVYDLCRKHSYLSGNNIVVLDIEASFERLNRTEGTSDRVDIILYNKKQGLLQFIEVKLFKNHEIRSSDENSIPLVVAQIKRYEEQIAKKEKTEIIPAYRNYVKAINQIFEIDLPLPDKVEPKVPLLINGFKSTELKALQNIISLQDGELFTL